MGVYFVVSVYLVVRDFFVFSVLHVVSLVLVANVLELFFDTNLVLAIERL